MRKALAGWLGTLLIGLLGGWVSAAFVGTFLHDTGFLGSTGESPEARAYMIGLLERDPASVANVRPNQDVAQRAIDLQSAQQSRSSTNTVPLSLTYLGGGSLGRMSVHIYAVGVRANGRDQFFPLALTLVGGKVVRSE